MARSIAEIKQTMTNAFMADSTVRERYGLSESDTFDDSFSVVSIENILFYIVAACSHVLEVLFDQFKADVDDKISRAVVASDLGTIKLQKSFSMVMLWSSMRRRNNMAMNRYLRRSESSNMLLYVTEDLL